MLDTNRLLMEQLLASRFNLMITTVNSLGEEREISTKVKKKDFLKETLNMKINVKMVDSYPTGEMELGWLYIKKDGKSAWMKEREGE